MSFLPRCKPMLIRLTLSHDDALRPHHRHRSWWRYPAHKLVLSGEKILFLERGDC